MRDKYEYKCIDTNSHMTNSDWDEIGNEGFRFVFENNHQFVFERRVPKKTRHVHRMADGTHVVRYSEE